MREQFRTLTGGLVERWNPVRFRFDGRAYTGCKGDTLAAALLANGVHLVGRSFKYHRPRGILTAGAEEPNALVHITRGLGHETPNLRATQVELYDGLTATSQNSYPDPAFDIGAIASLASRLLPAGFYYKTFMPSLGAWHRLFEPAIRRAAGLGRAPTAPDPDRYTNCFVHCDVLIVGAGPAGLAAARSAAATGARVILCDEQSQPGGSLLAETAAHIGNRPARNWAAETTAELARNPRVIVLPRTTAFGYYADNFLALAERLTDHLATPNPDVPRERLWQVRARHVVLATGAIERPLVFPGNDRPGIMLADAARTYLHRYGVRAGTTAVVLAAHDSAYRTALDLHAAGLRIALIADTRADAHGEWPEKARAAGITVQVDTIATGTQGHLRVHTLRTRHIPTGRIDTHHADLVLMGGGWTPTVHLFSQSRGRLRYDDTLGCHLPDIPAQNVSCAGACRGVFDLNAVLEDGHRAGEQAARTAPAIPTPTAAGALPMSGTLPPITPGKHAFIDFQNDVTEADIGLAVREGFRGVEHVKRYTTAGMATDQGKLSNANALAIIARHSQRAIADLGHTTYRPPYTPVTFGTIAGFNRGDLFDPIRRTPLHDQAAEDGAMFEDVGTWKRAHYFPRAGESRHAAVARECDTVRNTLGIFDASTLGKIDVSGPDAAAFLDRIYATRIDNLAIGKCRYAIMLTEAGFVMDDGIVARTGETSFHLTTTTGSAARVLAHMEDYLQTEWPDLRVWLTSTTEQWAVIALQGPRARQVLAPLLDDIDLTDLPHMSMRAGHVQGIPARLFRVSFTGELGYELNIPASLAPPIWAASHDATRQAGGCAYGTDTMHVLRAEKGYIVVGQETDGTVSLDDIGFGAHGRAKRDFVGKRSLALPDMRAPGRLQLVGLLPDALLEEGAQITARPDPPAGTRALGHVTSSYHSPALNRPIALALLANGRSRHGETVFVPMPGGAIQARITPPLFLDPEGTRLHG